jgi:hypothetical protein
LTSSLLFLQTTYLSLPAASLIDLISLITGISDKGGA